MALIEDIIPQLLHLTARSYGNGPGDKSPAELLREGRYDYVPSFAAAVVFLVLFGIGLFANIFQFFWHKAWFWWVMILAISCRCNLATDLGSGPAIVLLLIAETVEFVGYVARAISIKNLDEKGIFIVQIVLILVAPAVMAAACYMAFGRVVLWAVPPRFQTARYLWVPARRITPIFVGSDVFSFFIQAIGGLDSGRGGHSSTCRHWEERDSCRTWVASSVVWLLCRCQLPASHFAQERSRRLGTTQGAQLAIVLDSRQRGQHIDPDPDRTEVDRICTGHQQLPPQPRVVFLCL